jgi:hypothetical protein
LTVIVTKFVSTPRLDRAAWSGHRPVDLPAMPYSHDQDDELPVHDLLEAR